MLSVLVAETAFTVPAKPLGHSKAAAKPRAAVSMGDLSIESSGMKFPNPFVIGSGPPGTNYRSMAGCYKSGWGGVVAKTVSLTDFPVVNVAPRYAKHRLPNGELVGFQNIELISDRPLEDLLDDFKRLKDQFPDRVLVGSIMEMYEKERWQELAQRCCEAGCDGLELNFSCPHGHPERNMGAAMGQDPAMVEEVTGWVTAAVDQPVWAKMTPNIGDICQPARAAMRGGAHGVSAINTILSVTGVDMKTLRPLPTVAGHSTPGGYSYAAVKPIALRMVSELKRDAPDMEVSGIGGVVTVRRDATLAPPAATSHWPASHAPLLPLQARDAIEHLLLGASTVQSCTGPMIHGSGMVEGLIDGLGDFLGEKGFGSVREVVGHSLPYFTSHHDLADRQKAKKEGTEKSSDMQWTEDLTTTTQELMTN